MKLLGVRRPVGALVGAGLTAPSYLQDSTKDKGLRQVAANESADRSAHSKELAHSAAQPAVGTAFRTVHF